MRGGRAPHEGRCHLLLLFLLWLLLLLLRSLVISLSTRLASSACGSSSPLTSPAGSGLLDKNIQLRKKRERYIKKNNVQTN